jgi:hypothetical protein
MEMPGRWLPCLTIHAEGEAKQDRRRKMVSAAVGAALDQERALATAAMRSNALSMFSSELAYDSRR